MAVVDCLLESVISPATLVVWVHTTGPNLPPTEPTSSPVIWLLDISTGIASLGDILLLWSLLCSYLGRTIDSVFPLVACIAP